MNTLGSTRSSIQSGDSGTNFWNTTPTFGTPPHRAPAQREHQRARVGILVHLFGSPLHRAAGPPTRPRATPYMVTVLVHPLEHHPTEPQGQTARVGILGHLSMVRGAGQSKVAARNNHMCLGLPAENQHPPFAPSKTARLDQYYGARPIPLARPIHRTSEPNLMKSVHPCDVTPLMP